MVEYQYIEKQFNEYILEYQYIEKHSAPFLKKLLTMETILTTETNISIVISQRWETFLHD
jgi:hypothetical protein